MREGYTSRDIRYTYKDGNVYAFVLKCPYDGEIFCTELKSDKKHYFDFTVKKISLLGFPDDSFTYERNSEALHISLDMNKVKTEYPLCFKIKID